MARKAKIAKANRLKARYENQLQSGVKPTKPTRVFNACSVCGRTRGYLGLFGICRICFRERANAGELPGVRKSSW
ncbi:type Z 30S ribosomal protein S14 [Candidatus Gracilibacteria bacterium]|nr:type Z 30S ribosomal protein S14 [Candidatus Gracilibacteria bacterium]